MIPSEDNETNPSPGSNKKGSIILIVSVVLVIALLFSLGLYFRWMGWQEQKGRVVNNSIPNVSVMTAQPESEEIVLTLPGFLVAYNLTPILARTNGYLKNFLVDIGDEVKVNQLLCEIDTPDVDAEWIQAKADLENAIAKRGIAKITAERWAGLYAHDSESISKQEVDQTSAEYTSAVANVGAAQANVKHLEVLKNFKYVFAPFNGIIVERNIDIGSLISAGNETMTQPYIIGLETVSQPLFKIANTEILRVFVEVPQPYYPYIKDGVKAQVSVPEYPEQIFTGVIDRNAIALDQVSRTLLTQVNIENKGNLLRPGLYSEVKFSFKPYKDSFKIPIAALIIRDGPPFVAILKEDNTVSMQQVQIGKDYGKSVQIIKGVKEGDSIILNPTYRIRDGIKVKIRPAAPAEV
jgi:multidrug efflux pump subunit AcrA (membrane-fusion protein)